MWFADGIPAYPSMTPVWDGDRLVFGGWIPDGADPDLPTFDALLAGGAETRAGAIRLGSGNATLDDWGHGNDKNRDGWMDRAEWEEVERF